MGKQKSLYPHEIDGRRILKYACWFVYDRVCLCTRARELKTGIDREWWLWEQLRGHHPQTWCPRVFIKASTEVITCCYVLSLNANTPQPYPYLLPPYTLGSDTCQICCEQPTAFDRDASLTMLFKRQYTQACVYIGVSVCLGYNRGIMQVIPMSVHIKQVGLTEKGTFFGEFSQSSHPCILKPSAAVSIPIMIIYTYISIVSIYPGYKSLAILSHL